MELSRVGEKTIFRMKTSNVNEGQNKKLKNGIVDIF